MMILLFMVLLNYTVFSTFIFFQKKQYVYFRCCWSWFIGGGGGVHLPRASAIAAFDTFSERSGLYSELLLESGETGQS